jgi:hypothetical protein
VRGRQLSYRHRRRLIWLSILAVVASGVAAAIVLLPRGEKVDRGPTSPLPAPTSVQAKPGKPHPTRLTADDKTQLKSTVALFISTSVARHHPERSWPIIDPILREGLTKKQWSTGNIPVVPFPAAGVDLIQLQEIQDRKALVEVMLAPTRQSHLPHKTFQIELRLQPRGSHRWTVAAWVPEGVSTRIDTSPPDVVAAAAHPRHFSAVWIVVPLSLFVAALVLLPVGILARDHYRFRRARSRFHAHRDDAGRLGR